MITLGFWLGVFCCLGEAKFSQKVLAEIPDAVSNMLDREEVDAP